MLLGCRVSCLPRAGAIAVSSADVPWMERGIATVVPGVYPAARGERARAAPLLVCFSEPVVLSCCRSVAMPRSPAGGVGCRAVCHLPPRGTSFRHAAIATDGAWARPDHYRPACRFWSAPLIQQKTLGWHCHGRQHPALAWLAADHVTYRGDRLVNG